MMKRNTINTILSLFNKQFLVLFLLPLLFFAGCSKDQNTDLGLVELERGDALISVDLSATEEIGEDNSFQQKKSSVAPTDQSLVLQEAVFRVNNGMHVEMKLEDKTLEKYFRSDKITTKNTVSQGDKKMVSTVKTSVLKSDVKYRMVIFDENGNWRLDKDYVYGKESITPGVPLDAGKKYSFIIYSINSTSAPIPDVTYAGGVKTFSNASLSNISADLMVFRVKDKLLTFGENRLNAVMVHKFSEITTTVAVDPSMASGIAQLTNATLSKVSASGNYNFLTEALSYNGEGTVDANVSFPTFTNVRRSITSSPTLIINKTENNLELNFGSLTIDEETKTNVKISGVKVIPGHKYNLILTFKSCTYSVQTTNEINWDYPANSSYTGCVINGVNHPNNEVISNPLITAPAADYGFIFDLTRLDNAFNMTINGVDLFTDPAGGAQSQIQFQSINNISRNVQFIDGTEHGVGGIPNIWTLRGTTDKPIIRLIISKTGQISLLGSKTSGGDLVQMVLKNNKTFNTIHWNKDSDNTILITQRVENATTIIGNGYGRKKTPCSTTP